jgi:hypothetical protein
MCPYCVVCSEEQTTVACVEETLGRPASEETRELNKEMARRNKRKKERKIKLSPQQAVEAYRVVRC